MVQSMDMHEHALIRVAEFQAESILSKFIFGLGLDESVIFATRKAAAE